MEFASVITLSITRSKETRTDLYYLDSKTQLTRTIKKIRGVFAVEDLKRFIIGFEGLFSELARDVNVNNFSDQDWVISMDDIGNGKIVLIDLSKLPEEAYILFISRTIWTNPKDKTEKQISFEAKVFSQKGVIDKYQRVLIVRGNAVYDANFS